MTIFILEGALSIQTDNVYMAMICLEELEQTFCSRCLVMCLELKDGHKGRYKTRRTIPCDMS